MRWKAMLLIVPLLGLPLRAAQDPVRPDGTVRRERTVASETIQAATNRAVSALFDQIAAQPLTSRTTVGQFLRELNAEGEFDKVLHGADQIGGPRWIDDQTCQVQLEITAERVGGALQAMAGRATAPIVSAADISRAVAGWYRRVFAATGTASFAKRLVELRPAVGERWTVVSDKERRQALARANSAAADRCIESIGPVLLSDRKTLGEALALPEVRTPVQDWLASRPVTRVDFRDNLEVEVQLSADQRDFFSVVRGALAKQSQIDLPKDAAGWRRIEQEFQTHFASPVGRAAVLNESRPAPTGMMPLPERMPDWVDRRVEVQGIAMAKGPALKTSIKAELDARAKLLSRIEGLPLDRDTTLGEIARQRTDIAESIARTVKQAKIEKIDYRADGSVVVQMSADLRDLWYDLRR